MIRMIAAVARAPIALRAFQFEEMFFRSSADFGRYLEVKEGVMGAGKPMLRGCVLDGRRPSPPSAGDWEHS